MRCAGRKLAQRGALMADSMQNDGHEATVARPTDETEHFSAGSPGHSPPSDVYYSAPRNQTDSPEEVTGFDASTVEQSSGAAAFRGSDTETEK
jgi:hypothetical protein